MKLEQGRQTNSEAREPSKVTEAEELLQLKVEIMERWDRLPAEHQATMALMIYSTVIDQGEYAEWLRGAVALSRPPDGEPPQNLPEDIF